MILSTRPGSDGDQERMVLGWLKQTGLHVEVTETDGGSREGVIERMGQHQVLLTSNDGSLAVFEIEDIAEVEIT